MQKIGKMTTLIQQLTGLRGVIHIGAHHGQEGAGYRALGIDRVCWVEPLPSAFAELVKSQVGTNAAFFQCALGAKNEEAIFYIADNAGQSSSLRKPKIHLQEHPEVNFIDTITVPVRRLEDLPINFEAFNLLVLDVQGCELDVLQGAQEILGAFDYIIAEVQNAELYEGGALLPELAAWIAQRGFALERIEWETNAWGNALFVHERAIHRPSVHAFIFHWGDGERGRELAKRTHALTEIIEPNVDRLTVISSGGTGGSRNWQVIDGKAYFGTQWNHALSEFSGDVLFHHQADAMLLGADYEGMLYAGRQSFRAHQCGVYSPRVDHSAWDASHRHLQEKAPGRFAVANTDCTCWMIHRSVLCRQPRNLNTRLGWGIDVLYCEQARVMGLNVFRDYRYLVHHPQGTGYLCDEASKEMEQFQNMYKAQATSHGDGW